METKPKLSPAEECVERTLTRFEDSLQLCEAVAKEVLADLHTAGFIVVPKEAFESIQRDKEASS